ncbi:MAG TPA: glucokinase [Ktedonobacteraceae bacterium]|nr:glucokinase [Ktedonobacteraceae bacterium]
MLLAGDIGGTKTKLAVFSQEQGWRVPLAEEIFPSADYTGLEVAARKFLAKHDFKIEQACFGVAGPVVEGAATITNLSWVMKESQLAQDLNIPTVKLLNDLESIAHAVPFLEASDLDTINVGQPVPHGTLAVIAPGTGLGEAYLTWNGTAYQAHNSEGGHADFAPTNLFELELLRYVMQRFPHVSYERVCSGKGIPNIYDYLKDSGYAEEPGWMAERLAGARDRTLIIMNTALDPDLDCELCTATLNTFVAILGAEAGNLMLKVLANGGVYIGGGIPPRILPYLHEKRFMQAFQHKGRFTHMMSEVPVHVILNPDIALLGAASYGFGM